MPNGWKKSKAKGFGKKAACGGGSNSFTGWEKNWRYSGSKVRARAGNCSSLDWYVTRFHMHNGSKLLKRLAARAALVRDVRQLRASLCR
jgi:hypothetical protein